MLDVPQHVLRFWETRFPQIKPVKRAGGRRFYRPEDVDLLRGIQLLLYFEGYTINGAQKVLREKGVRYTASLGRGQARNGRSIAEAAEEIVHILEEAGFATPRSKDDDTGEIPSTAAATEAIEHILEEGGLEGFADAHPVDEDAGKVPGAEVSAPDAHENSPQTAAGQSSDAPFTRDLVFRAAEVLSGASPRRARLEALRTELLGLKSRLAAARLRH